MLTKIDDSLWTVTAPLTFLGLHLGTRMTVVALRDGGLLLHSPIPLTDDLRAEIDALGAVRHIVCPNLFHHLYAGLWTTAYPSALLHGPEGLAKKRPDLPALCPLSEAPHPDWKGDLVPLHINGCMLDETLFLHPRSRTLISSDLTENFETSDHLLTRLYLKVGGIHGKVGVSRLLRLLYRDHQAARASIDRLLTHDFDRVVLAHGRIIEKGGKDAVQATFTWL